MQSAGQQQIPLRETLVAAQVEMRREPSTSVHPLLRSGTGGATSNENSKITSLSRINGDVYSSSLSPSATSRRHPSLTRNFGLSEDDDNDKVFDDPLLHKSSSHDPLSIPLSSEDTLAFTPRSSRRTVKSASDERAEAAAAEWDGYKASIMQRFTTSGTITVSTNFDIISKEPKGELSNSQKTKQDQIYQMAS